MLTEQVQIVKLQNYVETISRKPCTLIDQNLKGNAERGPFTESLELCPF